MAAHNPDQYSLIMLKSLLQVVVGDNSKSYLLYGLWLLTLVEEGISFCCRLETHYKLLGILAEVVQLPISSFSSATRQSEIVMKAINT